MSESTSRREFLRNALSVIVLASTSPFVMLGRITPRLRTNGSGQLVATYVLYIKDYSDYSQLLTVGGSVKLTAPNQLLLNPDQVQHAYTGKIFPIAVTRIAESGTNAFAAVSTYCTHGFDFQVGDYNPITGHFVCPHNHSTFTADGTHVDLPSTPPVGNLRKFPTVYDETAGSITFENVLAVADVDDVNVPPASVYLEQNYPNPFNPTTLIRYGVPDAMHVTLTVHSLDGAAIETIVDAWQEAGTYTVDFSADRIPSGTYFYRLQTASGVLTRRLVVLK